MYCNAVYISCQHKRGKMELFHIITTRQRDRQQPEMRLHSQDKRPQVITYVSLLFEVVETSTSEIPASQELFTLGLVICGRPCVRLVFLIFGAKKGSLSSADSLRTVRGVRELQSA